jgi:hypothetical protein
MRSKRSEMIHIYDAARQPDRCEGCPDRRTADNKISACFLLEAKGDADRAPA